MAPRGARTEQLAQERKLTAEQAARELEREEERRRKFYRYYFEIDPDDPPLYDAAVNTRSLSLDAAAERMVLAYHARFGHAG